MGNTLFLIRKALLKINPWGNEDALIEEEMEEELKKGHDPTFAHINNLSDDEKPLRIVDREGWGAKKPKWRQRLKTPVDRYILRYFTKSEYCLGDEECSQILQDLQKDHMALGMPDIAYNFMIGLDGTVYEGRGWTTKGTKEDYHTIKEHGKTIDIALVGDFKTKHPPAEMNQAACRLMQKGVNLGHSKIGWELTEVRKEFPYTTWDILEAENKDPDEKIYVDQDNKAGQ